MGDSQSGVTACTIVARNYLPAARILARSYLAKHPDHRFVICVTDVPADHAETDSGALVVGSGHVAISAEDYLRMATAYSVTELATAVKPFLITALRADAEVVIYLDPDIKVFAPMPEIAELARAHQLVLTPHLLGPMPRDGKEPDEAVIMGTGIFNLGFIACGPGSAEFLDFWAARLRHDAIVDPERQLFTDQRWVDQVPALFPHVVHTDPGCNVAYWNAHERPLADDSGVVSASGSALKFFHFSGYRPERPWVLTYHCARKPRVVLSDHPVIRRLCDEYGAELRSSGYAESIESIPYGFAKLGDGTKLSTAMRRLFRAQWMESEFEDAERTVVIETPPHAFDGTDAFAEWLSGAADQAQQRSGLNRLVMSAWSGRPDLQRAFPQPYGADADGFRHWCENSGVAELGLPKWALPKKIEHPVVDTDKTLGVNMLGYLTAELGLGEMARLLHDAAIDSGIPVASIVEDKAVSNRASLDRPATESAARFGVSLLCVNADQTQVMAEAHPEVFSGRYRIGFWAWELEDFPQWLHSAFGMVDEIWTVSEFCAAAISKHTTVPVKVFPAPVRETTPLISNKEKGYTQFLFAFDFNSVGERKNPWGLVEAFQLAFPDRDDVRLVIKAINGSRHPISQERLRMAAIDDKRITLLERYLSVAELEQLYRDSDCYVSLHRSEGFGLTVAQAMAMGMPVISTNYSSTTEFTNEHTGWLVPYSMVNVGKDCFPYHEKAVWAEPDLDAAALAMRQVVEEPAEAAVRGAAAREHIKDTRSMAAAAKWVHEQLLSAHRNWLAGLEKPQRSEEIRDPLQPLTSAKEALRWRPDPGANSRNPVAPAVRKTMLRLLDHYDVHQRDVLNELTDGGTETARLLLQRIEWLEARMAGATTDAASARSAAERTEARLVAVEDGQADLKNRAPGQELALRNMENDVRELRIDFQQRGEELDTERTQVRSEFTERDQRSDLAEHQLGELNRRWIAHEESARLRHSPLPPGTEVVLCDAGALLLPADEVILPWLTYHRSWEPAESALMAALMGDGTFLDVGAHVGYHSLALLRRLGAVRKIVAVEADPVNAALLRRNIEVNLPSAIAEKVEVLECAAWDSDTTVHINRVEANNSGDVRVRSDGSGVSVPAIRLDGHPALGERIDVIKTDLQGRDHRAFTGLAGIIERDQPHLVVEFSPESIEELGDDPGAALEGYLREDYEPIVVTENGPEQEPRPVTDLCALARAQESGLLTLWLRPATH